MSAGRYPSPPSSLPLVVTELNSFHLQKELVEKLRPILVSEPELATCRSCGVLSNFAPDGSTPLHCAARWGNLDVVCLLLSLKKSPQSRERLVDVWSRDLQGRVPLHLAAEYECESVCRKLIEVMTEAEVDTGSGLTPSPQSGNPLSVVGCCAPVDLTGTTPLGWASIRKKGRPSSPICELLYGQGDNSILPQRVYSERSGKTPIRRAHHRNQNHINHSEDMRLRADHIIFAHSEAQGWRTEMEDASVSCCPLSSDDLQTYWLFGVFDGHGGDFSSKFVATHFPSMFLSSLERRSRDESEGSPWSTQALEKMLSDSCQSMDALLSEEERMKVSAKSSGPKGAVTLNLRDTSGTTSCVCLFTLNDLFIANIGDSRAVLARASDSHLCASPTAIALSTDQKLSLVEESTRASSAGCL